ncbi:hypothetical protein COLO4_30695 [Corchorus olitorius]|uniref:F-box protein At3g26010-like beta-propeller domain-containing protein n=1 Tax=Corchorus olitorius TaxID=93759 RepID=A0A1R3H782_9ROSI|nr:hypothetical protein COLO4_30695 [Corchorus olitorius]
MGAHPHPCNSAKSNTRLALAYPPIEDLNYDLFTEILIRIPCSKTFFICKSVSKRWLKILSDPDVIRRWLYRHKPYSTVTFMVGGYGPISQEPIFQSIGFRFDFLSLSIGFLKILASSNDLLLCCSVFELIHRPIYYVCNPFTKQSVALPHAPTHNKEMGGLKFGLLSDHCDSNQAIRGIGIHYHQHWRHKVVRVHSDFYNWFVDVFCFQTGKWTQTVLPIKDRKYCVVDIKDFPCNGGVLISISRNYGVIAYDTYTMNQCHLKGNPDSNFAYDVPIFGPMPTIYDQCEGICCGIFRRVYYSSCGKLKVEDKDVKDYKSEEFRYFHIGYDEIIRQNDWVRNYIDRSDEEQHPLKPFAVHPSDRDVVFLKTREDVFSCSLKTKELKLAGKAPADCQPNQSFPIELPRWPTHIPTLPA